MAKQLTPTANANASSFGWRLAAACAVYALLVGTVFGDKLFRTDEVLSLLGTDIWRQFYAWRMFGFGELAKWHLALWNPYIFSGAPYLGGFQSALLYPPNWICMVFPLPMAIDFEVALHIFLAGAFMYCWAAYRRLSWPACVAAGLIFMFGGPEFGRIVPGHITDINTLVWAPLIFLAVDDLTLGSSLRGALLGSAAFAMQICAGHAQFAFYTAVAATIYFALNLHAAPACRRAILGFFICFAGGGLLAAAQLFTGLGAISETIRSHTTYAFASTYSFPPENLLTMILPGFFGGGMPQPNTMITSIYQSLGNGIDHTLPYWGRWFWWEAGTYVGVVGLGLACIALATPRRGRRFVFTMAILTLLLGMGKYIFPIFWVIYRLPGFSSFRGTAKFMFLFVMFVSMLSGIGLDRLLAGKIKTIRPALAIAIVSAVLLALALVMNAQAIGDWTSLWGRILKSVAWTHERSMVQDVNLDFLYRSAKTAAGELCWAGFVGLLLAGLLLGAKWNRRVLLGIPVLLAVEMMVFANDYKPTFALSRYRRQIEAAAKCLAPLPPDARVWANDQGQLMMAGRLNAWGDDPMMLRRYVEFMADAIGSSSGTIMTGRPKLPPHDARLPRLVRMAGVLFIDRDGAHLYKLNAPILPRAELVGRVQVEPDRARLLAAMNDPHFDPIHTALIESQIDPMPTGGTDPGRVTVRDINSDTLDIEAWANSPCLLVLTDSYSRGWHAEALPGSAQKQYQVIPADLTLRGVPLSAGHHHFRMIYRPMAFVVGEWTSLAAIGAWVAMGVVAVRRRQKSRREAGD